MRSAIQYGKLITEFHGRVFTSILHALQFLFFF